MAQGALCGGPLLTKRGSVAVGVNLEPLILAPLDGSMLNRLSALSAFGSAGVVLGDSTEPL